MNKTITIRQIICAFLVLSITLIHEHIPKSASKIAGSAGYISVIVGGIIGAFIAFCICFLIRNFPSKNIYEILEILVGKIGAKLVLILFFFWAGANVITVLHFHSLISQNTLMPFTPDRLIFFNMLALSAYCLCKGIKVAMRISELFVTLFILNLVFLLVVAMKDFDFVNLLPVSSSDTANIIIASPHSFSVFGLIFLALFYADKLEKPQTSFKPFGLYILVVFLLAFFISVVTIGTQGATLTANYTLPFGAVVKHSSLSAFFERLEVFLLLPTFISDFLEIVFFISVMLLSFKWVFNVKKPLYFAIFLFPAVYFTALILENTQFALEDFYENYLVIINSVFELCLPIIMVILTLVKKKYIAKK